jgi:hypothetical protein
MLSVPLKANDYIQFAGIYAFSRFFSPCTNSSFISATCVAVLLPAAAEVLDDGLARGLQKERVKKT